MARHSTRGPAAEKLLSPKLLCVCGSILYGLNLLQQVVGYAIQERITTVGAIGLKSKGSNSSRVHHSFKTLRIQDISAPSDWYRSVRMVRHPMPKCLADISVLEPNCLDLQQTFFATIGHTEERFNITGY